MCAGIEVVLEPRELLVMEGGVAKFRCSPHIPIALPILIRDGAYFAPWNSDGRLQYVDQVSPGPGVFGNRTYSLSRVSLQDNGTLYQCSVANYPSNVVTLSVFGKRCTCERERNDCVCGNSSWNVYVW